MQEILNENPEGIFIRLSSRRLLSLHMLIFSPKDAAVLSEEAKAFITSEVAKHKLEGETSETIAFLNAVGKCMAIKSPKKALELLTGSKRVYEDLDFRLMQIANKKDQMVDKPKEIVCMKIILRAFRCTF